MPVGFRWKHFLPRFPALIFLLSILSISSHEEFEGWEFLGCEFSWGEIDGWEFLGWEFSWGDFYGREFSGRKFS